MRTAPVPRHRPQDDAPTMPEPWQTGHLTVSVIFTSKQRLTQKG
jgi:hypothetical protein